MTSDDAVAMLEIKLRAANTALIDAGFMLGKSRQENEQMRVELDRLRGTDVWEEAHMNDSLRRDIERQRARIADLEAQLLTALGERRP